MASQQSDFWPEKQPSGDRPAATLEPQDFANRFAEILGDSLVSVILHGPGASGEKPGEPPEYKLLVVLRKIGVAELERAGPLVRTWVESGQPVPLFFSEERLLRSAATYPVELLDMKEGHQVLHGRDPVTGLEVKKELLLLDIERGLKSQLHRICEAHMLSGGKRASFHAALHRELPRLNLLLRSVLRLYVPRSPSGVVEVVSKLESYVPGVSEALIPVYAFVWGREVAGVKPVKRVGDLLEVLIPLFQGLIAVVEAQRMKQLEAWG